MSIIIRTSEEIKKMRIAGRLAAEVLEIITPYVQPGISTETLDKICSEHITIKQKATAASLGYKGFPKSVCISVNDVVCHGIPNNKEILKEGDIANIDVTIMKDGFYGDTSKMFWVGEPSAIGQHLCKIAQEGLYLAIQIIKPGIRLKYIGQTIQKFVEKNNFSVVRDYCGHGIGKCFHGYPQILHYEADDYGLILQTGMAFTIEPMINAGKNFVYLTKDGWTVKTKDKSLSAQYEHTVIVTDNGYEITTLRTNESLPT